jgi:hypothetical protein
MTGAVELQAVRERRYPPVEDLQDTLYVTSGNTLGHLTVAYRALAADLYWIRAIQYFGGTKQRVEAQPAAANPSARREFELLYPMLDVTTTLDPLFNIAYRFGAIFLAEGYPTGPGRPDRAIKLLEKGLRERPDKWEYMEDIGFVHYWYVHDYRAAAGWFQKGSELPGAPWWLRSLAATTLAQGGDRQSSRLMWEAIRQSAEIDWLRQDAERRLLQLRALDEIDALQQRVDAFARGAGQAPAGWQALVRARVVPGVPLDPSRTPYELTSEGRVHIAQGSPLSPLPEEPQRIEAPEAPPRS